MYGLERVLLMRNGILERFPNSRTLCNAAEGGIFLRKMPPNGGGFGLHQFGNRCRPPFRCAGDSLLPKFRRRGPFGCTAPVPVVRTIEAQLDFDYAPRAHNYLQKGSRYSDSKGRATLDQVP